MRETAEFEFGGFGASGERARAGQQALRRRASGPRPVRPAVAPVGVRPAQAAWPEARGASRRPGPRVLARRAVAPAPAMALRFRIRRAVATVVLVVAVAAVVVALGLVADAVSAARTPEPPRSSTVQTWPGPVLEVPGG